MLKNMGHASTEVVGRDMNYVLFTTAFSDQVTIIHLEMQIVILRVKCQIVEKSYGHFTIVNVMIL